LILSKPSETWSEHPTANAAEPQRRSVALVQLIAIVTLALSTLIAATVVSIGLVRADVAGSVVSQEAGPVAGKIVTGEPR
jgi:hypothetical protein